MSKSLALATICSLRFGSRFLFLAASYALPILAAGQTNAELIQNAAWYERQIAQGVTAKSYQFDNLFNSRQAIHIIEADMDVPGVTFKLPFRQNGTRLTVPAFAATVTGATASVNGNFFDSPGSVQYLRVNNATVATTLPGVADAGGIAITAAGDLLALQRPGSGWPSRTEPDVMATNVPVMVNGARYPFPLDNFYAVDRHPRTVIGVTLDNRMFMMIVDGRSSTAAGMTFVELYETMKALGAHNAVNMDGGGSSTIWDSESPGNGIWNKPSGGAARAVANSIVLVAPPAAAATSFFDARPAFNGLHSSPLQSVNLAVESGELVSTQLGFVNRGTSTWTASNVVLSTTEARSRNSSLFDPSYWLSPSVVSTLPGGSILPGQSAYFPVRFKAPEVNVPTSYVESFGLRTASGIFFGPEQNRIYLTVMPKSDAEIVVESRLPDGSLNSNAYLESPAMANTTSKSSATNPPVYGTGARYTATLNTVATFTANIANTGIYNVYVTMGSGSNNNALASYTLNHSQGSLTGNINLTYTDSTLVNQWKLLASEVHLSGGTQSTVTFTNTTGDNSSGRRFVMDAVRFSRLANSKVVDWSLY